MDASEELDILVQDPSTYLLESGDIVEVYKCKVRQLGKISKLIKLLLKELGVDSINTGEVAIDLNDPQVYFALFESCEDAMLDVLASLCSLEREQVEDLDIAEAIELTLCIFTLNRDFFLKRALPLIKSLMPAPQ